MRIFRLHTPYTALLPALLFLLASCIFQRSGHPLLSLADSLLDSCPDSALHLLESLPPDALHDEADRARYALLMTQARDKNYLPHTDDSLIRTAVDYYDRQQETEMQARSYYVSGGVYRERKEYGKALKCYYTALSHAQQSEDIALTGLIYNNVASLYYYQKRYEKADSIQNLVCRIAIQLHDTLLEAESFSRQGKIRFEQERYAEAEEKQLRALAVLGTFRSNRMRAEITAALSRICGMTDRPELAVRYAWQSFAYQEDTARCYETFNLIGEAYFKANRYDSAVAFLQKGLSSSDYVEKAGAYMRLADIAKARGEERESGELERLYSDYLDSLNQSSQSMEMLETESQVFLQQQQERYETFLYRHRYLFIFGTMSALLLVAAWLWRRYRKQLQRQNRKFHLAEDSWLQQSNRQAEEIRKKESRIASLQSDLALLEKDWQSEVLAKIKRILNDIKREVRSQESLDETDWLCLKKQVDKNEAIARLAMQYNFTGRETRYCYLLLLNLSTTGRAALLKLSRQTLYRFEQNILAKMNEKYEKGKLQQMLAKRIEEAGDE